MSEFKITSMRLSHREPRNDGSVVKAHFECAVRGMRLVNCQIIERPEGTIHVMPPMVKVGRERFRAVKFDEPSLAADFIAAALSAFHAIERARREVSDDVADSLAMAGIDR